eukprot:366094-Chlamydomonas_euryale.AAC.8
MHGHMPTAWPDLFALATVAWLPGIDRSMAAWHTCTTPQPRLHGKVEQFGSDRVEDLRLERLMRATHIGCYGHWKLSSASNPVGAAGIVSETCFGVGCSRVEY